MPKTDQDQDYIRLIRARLGEVWPQAKAEILATLPDHLDAADIGKYVDERDEPGIHTNEWGVVPYFYAHRDSKRLLEFYRIRSLKD
jgi:hypothetical protein